jgi:chitodextrinase
MSGLTAYRGGVAGNTSGQAVSTDGSGVFAVSIPALMLPVPIMLRRGDGLSSPATISVPRSEFVVSSDGLEWGPSCVIPSIADVNVAFHLRQLAKLPLGTSSVCRFSVVAGIAVDATPPTLTGSLALTPGANSLTAAWGAGADNVGVIGYELTLATDPGFTTGLVTHTLGAVTSDSFTGLDEETTYYLRLRDRDAAGNWSASYLSASGKPYDTTPPAQVMGLAAIPGIASVALVWSASSDARGVTGYRVKRATNSGMSSATTLTSSEATTGYTATGLAGNTAYWFTIEARDAAGNWSSVSSTATCTTAPAQVGTVTATAGDASVALTWAAIAGATVYRVERATDSGFTANLITLSSSVGTNAYTNNAAGGNTPANGTAYFYRVSASNGVFGLASAGATATPTSSGYFLAFGAANNHAASSPDGDAWTGQGSSSPFPSGQGNTAAWSPALGLWVAVGSGTPDYFATSPNGTAWTGLGAPVAGMQAYGIAWSPALGLFVAVGTGSNNMAWSSDGVHWTGLGKPVFSSLGYDVAWSPELGLFVAVGSGSANTIATSTNGIDWTGRGKTMFTSAGLGVCWGGSPANLFVAVGYGGHTVATSTDGINWTYRDGGAVQFPHAVAYSPALNVWVQTGENGGNGKILGYATDPTGTWTGVSSIFYAGNDVVWSPAIGKFVAVGTPGTACLAVSSNGSSWTGKGTTLFNSAGLGVAANG